MKILFACVPAEGHMGPLTGIAVHLRDRGHDVHWYTGPSLAPVVARMGLAFHPFRQAVEITGETIHDLFPERAALHGPALIRFDGEKIFIANTAASTTSATSTPAGTSTCCSATPPSTAPGRSSTCCASA